MTYNQLIELLQEKREEVKGNVKVQAIDERLPGWISKYYDIHTVKVKDNELLLVLVDDDE